MGEYLVSIIVIVLTAVVIGVIFFLVNRQKKQRDALIQQLAARQGWTYQKVNSTRQDGFMLRGDGWFFESLATSSGVSSQSGSSDVSYSNRWVSDRRTSPAGMVLIGPKLPSVNLGGLGNFMLQQALKVMLGDEAGEAAGLTEVEVGRSALRERFSVWAASTSAAEDVLTFEVENALLIWKLKEKPVIRVSTRGTEIKLKDGRIQDPGDITEVIRLGEAFLQG